MNSYIKDVSVARQWDIIVQVTRFGDYEQIVQLVKDGYAITLELLELLYRVGAQHLFSQIMPYDKDFFEKNFAQSLKMKVLKKALGEKPAIDIWKKVVFERENRIAEEKKQERQRLEARLDEQYKMFGFSDNFFESISSSYELMSLALKKYDRKSVAVGLVKYATYEFYIKNFKTFELIEYGLYDIALDTYYIWCNESEKIEAIRQIAQTDEGLEELVRRSSLAKNCREKRYLEEIAKDTVIRERLKSYGHEGYIILYDNETMTENEFEVWCKIEPNVVVFYKQFNKNIFWVIKNGYYKYLRR